MAIWPSAESLADVGVMLVIAFVWIVEAQRRNGGAQHFHGGSGLGEGAQQVVDSSGSDETGFGQAAAKVFQFSSIGQTAEPEQVGGLFKRRLSANS